MDHETYSVDECMIPYYGRHSSKQFIRGKPIRYGFKIWSMCTADGAGVHFEPYCGRSTNITDIGLGQGPNVVMDLIQKTNLSPGSEIFFDNLFTSFPLLNKMSEMGIAGTGTVRQNRLHKVPIVDKKEMSKKTVERGAQKVVYNEDQILVCWKDNKPVYIATNKYTGESKTTARRWSSSQKKKIQVPIPEVIRKYNDGMGGVDLLDSMVAVYRVPYRTKKWYFGIYAWSLNVSAVNAWRLKRKISGEKLPFLDFLREIVVGLLNKHGKAPNRSRISLGLTEDARYDGLNHWMISTGLDSKGKPKRRNCRQCALTGKRDNKTLLQCEKCAVPLHHMCHKEKFLSLLIVQVAKLFFFFKSQTSYTARNILLCANILTMVLQSSFLMVTKFYCNRNFSQIRGKFSTKKISAHLWKISLQ